MKGILLGLTFFLSFFTQAQEWNHYSFNELYDFDANTIYSICQDSSGIFYLGSSEGLFRFNGSQFTKFIDPKHSTEASNVKVDDQQRIWWANFSGQLFYLQNDSIHKVIDPSNNAAYILDYVVWQEQLYYYTTEQKNIFRLNLKTAELDTQFTSQSNSIVHALDLVNEEIHYITLESLDMPEGIAQSRVTCYSYNPDSDAKSSTSHTVNLSFKQLYAPLYTNENIYAHYIEDGSYGLVNVKTGNKEMLIENAYINRSSTNSISETKTRYYLDTKNGFYALDYPKTNSNKADKLLHLSEQSVSCVYEDSEGNIWAGTLSDGIYIIPNDKLYFRQLSDTKILSSCLDEANKLYFVDNQGQLFRSDFPYTKSEVLPFSEKLNFNMAYNPIDQSIYFVNQAIKYDTKANKFSSTSRAIYFRDILFLDENYAITTGVSQTNLTSYTSLKNQSYALAESLGIDSASNTYSTPLNEVGSRQIVQDKKHGQLYVSNNNSLSFFDMAGLHRNLLHDNEDILAIKLFADPQAGIWASTLKQQVLFIREGQLIEAYDVPEEIKDFAKHDKLLFLLGKKAIYRLDTETKSMLRIDETDGIYFEPKQHIFCRDSNLYIMGEHHLQALPISYAFVNENIPKLHVEEVKLFDEKLPLRATYDFKHNEDNLNFLFSSLSIRSQQQQLYHYRLLGASDAWTTTSSNAPFAHFPRLAPGDYTLEVKVCNEDELCSPIQSISFQVHQPYYQQWWFYILLMVLVASLIGLIANYRLREERKRASLEQEKEKLKKQMLNAQLEALRSQMNPHFMYNALNTIQSLILTKQREVASEYLADFADLTRKYLDQSKRDFIALSDEIETLQIYLRLEKLRFDESFSYSLHVEERIDKHHTFIPVMLIQPFVENALKHGLLHKRGDKLLTIQFSLKEEQLICSIEDNGIGREASAEINSRRKKPDAFATSAIEARIALYNEQGKDKITYQIDDLQDKNRNASGTRVSIQIPLKF